MQSTMYHSMLRISSLTLACVLLFESGVLSPLTKEYATQTHQYVATAIGMYATVEPNEYNQITAELTKQKTELDAREAALTEREISVGLNSERSIDNGISTYILSFILFILLVLIVLNYILDYVRMRNPVNDFKHGHAN